MKRITSILLLAALTLTISGCSIKAPIDEHGRKDTPARTGNGVVSHNPGYVEFSLDEIIQESDIIADVTIVEWLGEYNKRSNLTFFKAKLNNSIKGEGSGEIEIVQYGSTKFIDVEKPLFKNGNRLLIFARSMDDDVDDYGDVFKNKYRVFDSRLLYILEYKDQLYLLDRGGDFDYAFDNEGIKKLEGELKDSINEAFREHDPIFAEKGIRRHCDVYNYDDFIQKVQ